MSKVTTLIDLLLRLKRISQTDISVKTKINQSNLSKFLAGETDIRSSSLIKILNELEIDLEEILQNKIDVSMGKAPEQSELGNALETLIRESDTFSARTMLDSFASQFPEGRSKNVSSALAVIGDYKSNIKSIRSHA